jgi:hypothetical protein
MENKTVIRRKREGSNCKINDKIPLMIMCMLYFCYLSCFGSIVKMVVIKSGWIYCGKISLLSYCVAIERKECLGVNLIRKGRPVQGPVRKKGTIFNWENQWLKETNAYTQNHTRPHSKLPSPLDHDCSHPAMITDTNSANWLQKALNNLLSKTCISRCNWKTWTQS